MNEAPDFPKEVNAIYKGRRDTLIDGLSRIGWHIERPKGTMFVWARIPEPYAELTSLEFSTLCMQEAKVAISPGSGFGPGGKASSASRSSRTSSGSSKPSARCARASPNSVDTAHQRPIRLGAGAL